MKIKQNYILLLTAVALDRIFKYAVLSYTMDGVFLFSPRFVRFELHKNFGIVANLPLPRFLIIAVSALVIVLLVFSFLKSSSKKIKIALAMIFIGALSNLIDRIFFGYVVDYILLFNLSYINISDILILLGILFLLV